jgi:eukaryotic-like serine/threonine-protein kinase
MANAPDRQHWPITHIGGQFLPPGKADNAVSLAIAKDLLQREHPDGRYGLQAELARGGMGVIYVVHDQDLRRISAVKIITPELAADRRRMQAFIREARLTAQLEHPNIVPVHEIGIIAELGTPFYTMKRVQGEVLHDIINKLTEGDAPYQERFNRHRLLDIFRKVCDAVAYAHSKGIIHRDIKPENIMVGDFGEVLLMDWGLAKSVEDLQDDPDVSDAGTRLSQDDYMRTEDGVIKGSLAYIAPEQAFGDLSQIDRQTDIFLLGATLYHLFTHCPPYDAADIQGIITKAEKCDYLAPNQRNPASQIPLDLERIILKAMSPMKKNRYASVAQMSDDVDAFVAGKRVCGRRIFAPGENLMQHGDMTRDTFVIINGSVQVSRVFGGKETPIAVLGRGDIVGEMAGITHNVRSATVTALGTTDTLVISHDLMMEELEKLPPWMEKIVFSLADRVRLLDENVNPLMLRSRAFPVVNQLFCIFNVGWASARHAEQMGFLRDDLLDEVVMNLGIDRQSSEEILNILLANDLCALDDRGWVSIPDAATFKLFVDYARYKCGVQGGVWKSEAIFVLPEQDAYFRQVIRQLRQMAVDGGAPNAANGEQPATALSAKNKPPVSR